MTRKITPSVLLFTLAIAVAAQAQTFSGSLRLRGESWDWFEFGAAENSYSYLGVLGRAGLADAGKRVSWRVEAAIPLLAGLPEDAAAPAPGGQLGAGASYWQANDSVSTTVGIFIKQAFVRLGGPAGQGGHSIKGGRFEFMEGAEVTPENATLAALKRDRIAHRLIGNFGWTHVQRSYDGVLYNFDNAGANVTVAALRPTSGVFDVDGWRSLHIGAGYGAWTHAPKDGAHDLRVFVIGYRDYRDDPRPLKTDNRPPLVRAADNSDISVGTLGAHYLHVWTLAAGTLDLLFWGALQAGDWGAQAHRAHAFSVEAGLQPKVLTTWRPWLRAAYTQTSGDDDPADDRHRTFFQILPTPRIYARFPFYNLMNLQDASLSLLLRPGARLTLRAELHRLQLSESADLWYVGGGAFEPETFGFAGRPANGQRHLADTFDLSADYRVNQQISVNVYGAVARGGEVVQQIYSGRNARLVYVELELRK